MLKAVKVSILAVVAALGAIITPMLVPGTTTADPALDSEEQALLALVNQYRQQNGLGVLALDPSLLIAADWMSADMGANNYFSHTDSLGRDPFQRMRAFGYDYNTWLGENIAAGTSSAQTAFDLWKGSPPHNGNLLNPNYEVMGIARVYTAASSHLWYWTNDFGGYVVPAPATPTPAPTSDSDGDGFSAAVEAHLGTTPGDRCGHPDAGRAGSPSLAWPADLSMSASPNAVDFSDLVSFIAPVRRLGTSPGEPGYDRRWDIVPGKGIMSEDINIQDLSALVTSAPPMFGNQRAFGGPLCAP